MVDAVAVTVRALGFIAMFQAAGGALFLTVFGSRLPASAPGIGRGALAAAIAAALLVLAHFGLEAARLAGDFAGVLDPQMQQLAWQGATGTAVRLRLAGLLLVMVGLVTARQLREAGTVHHAGRVRQRVSGLLCVVGTAALVAAFTRVGHTVDHPHRAVLAGLLVAHLASVAFWFGAIWPLRQAVTLETPEAAAAVLEQFSRAAVWIVPGLLLAGGALALLLVPGWSVFGQPYGRLLLAKIVGFSALMGLAALNKLRLTPALRQHAASAAPRLRRSLAVEYLLIAAVLTVTAVMTGLYSPN